MSEDNVTVQLPAPLYRRLQQIGDWVHRDVVDILTEVVAMAERNSGPRNAAEAKMTQEYVAYQVMHEELLAKYAGQYVAIHQGQVIDHDESEALLLQRLNQNYPDEVVLMKQVRPGPEPPLRFRSPRLIKGAS